MRYTPEQYEILEQFKSGMNVMDLSDDEMIVYQDLIEHKLLRPDFTVANGWHVLSEAGKRVLLERQEYLDLLQKEAAKDAEDKKQKRFSNKVAIANLAISLASFLIGISLEFYIGVYSRVVEWGDQLATWVAGLFS